MPPATASFDDSFDFDEPARKKTPRKRAAPPKGKGPARKKGKKRRLPSIDMQRVTRWGAVGMSGALAMAIMVNALVLQKGRHPAPLFGKAIVLGPSPTAAPKPVVAARGAAEAPPARPVVEPEPAPAPTPVPHQTRQADMGAGDPIGALIDGKAAPAATPKVEGKTVIGAQRALAKLGFSLKATGTFGPQTRKAIEAFERDRHLPVNGELTHRVVKVLAAESGLRIE